MENINNSNIKKEERTPNRKNRKKNGRNKEKKNNTLYDKQNVENLEKCSSLNYDDEKGNVVINKLEDEQKEKIQSSEENSKNFLIGKITGSNAKEIMENDDKTQTKNKDITNSAEDNNINESDNAYEGKRNIDISLGNAEIVVEPLVFEEKLKMWKGTVDSIKEKKEDEKKLQEQRQLNLENVKLAHSLNKEEKILQQMYLEQLKKDEELAKQLEQELNAEIRNELTKIEQDDFKIATIIQNSFDSEENQQNNNTNNGQSNNKKVSKLKLLKEKFRKFFKKKSSK
ncbi:hypothetical protein PRELSG_0912600 [Plasmodium relictum]|uniref:Uncharacterized protein n=1 Tax=Plasmodium relictum TaxID=85471 RepID=A0A1J1H5J1_PLARL|nr:hypothetical protein PRELSG_0912600 [Plasmodium relictum]CRH00026.1 hypothetical protein PRELSG_0912600 [Plasmodium relictum]